MHQIFYPIFNMQKQNDMFIFIFVLYWFCIVEYYIDEWHKFKNKIYVSI